MEVTRKALLSRCLRHHLLRWPPQPVGDRRRSDAELRQLLHRRRRGAGFLTVRGAKL